jgi:peptide/nickel transport system ATP-binding protein/oligopeptide transport system ATP-binding protein
MQNLLKIQNLKTYFYERKGVIKAVQDVDIHLFQGETLALVGESGSGKTVTALSIMRLVPPPGRILSGTVEFRNQNLLLLTEKEMTSIRGKEIGLILQDPGSALNPVIPVGLQISEVLKAHFDLKRNEARSQAYKIMEKVQLPNVENLYKMYPHQLSGGLKQRVLIAIALACKPSLLIADEPTTALDVSIQSQILSLLKDLKKQFHLSLLLITHDLSIVSEMADWVAVMYAGRIIEQASTYNLYMNPLHPYTRALMDAVPRIGFSKDQQNKSIEPLSGTVPDMMNLPAGCPFHPRCPIAENICSKDNPPKKIINKRHYVICFKAEETHV